MTACRYRWLTWVLAALAATFDSGPADAASMLGDAEISGDGLEPRASLVTTTVEQDWASPGFRLELGLTYGQLSGLAGAPSGAGPGVVIRAGARVDQYGSLMASIRYALVSGDTGVDLAGVRFVTMVEPTWHLTPSLHVAVGLGIAGLVEGGTGRAEVDGAGRDALVAPITLASASPALPRCSGVGAASSLTLGWRKALGSLAATGFDLVVDGQQTLCVDDTNRVEPDTATAIVRRQWWPHLGAAVSWVVAWR